ncbi:ABC transporter permease [Nocardioides caldifontis]|uniref:ABC transporter permease n=1 Tax=Nocardioides caldifontis TaxID=2588938 RepID=UPI0011DFB7BA|nr:ABC transporter permease [Nocardioides caldifontis]
MAITPAALEEGVVADATGAEPVAGKSPTQIALRRLRKDKVAMFCAFLVLVMTVLAILAPVITGAMNIYWDVSHPDAPTGSEVLDVYGFPIIGPPFNGFTWEHPLGLAPRTGSDNLAYLLYGLRTSMIVAFSAAVLSTFIGVVIGLVSGFSRGWVDRVLSFITDMFLSFPSLLAMLALAPIIVSHFGGNLDLLGTVQFVTLIVILVIFGWMSLARLIRGQVLSLREREFIQAAEVIGVPTRQILFKELLPNLIAPIVITLSLNLPAFVALEAGLSFLGLGLSDIPSLGKMVSDARTYYSDYPLFLWVPVAAIGVLTLALNLLGDSVRDAFDPRTRR